MDIKVQQLTKTYHQQKAVDNISFEVKKGEIVGFLGPNGAGKSTTMKMITNYIAIEQGDIVIGERSIKQEAQLLKKHIGYLPEHNPLYAEMPIIDYLQFCAALQGIPPQKIDVKVKDMISLCGLTVEKHKKIGELSRGYRQRVGLAQAMIHDPAILILDEPTSGLDPNQIVEIRKLIKEFGKEKTVIFSTHILPEVEATCDRILIINKGKIIADGTPMALRQQAQGQEILTVKIEDGEQSSVLKTLQGLASVASITPIHHEQPYFNVHSAPQKSSKRAIFQACVANHWVLTELTATETKLEDIFKKLTMG